MKVTTLRLLVGITTPLILTGSVQSGFTGISTVSKPNDFGLLVCNVYAEFDRPGEDYLWGIAGTVDGPMLIQVIGGTFYNHVFGTDRAPYAPDLAAFPSLAYDTFATIGVKSFGPGGQPEDLLEFSPGFPGLDGSSISTDESGWGVVPGDPQWDPFDPDFFAGDGRILIGQFSTADGSAIQGTMLIAGIFNGEVARHVVSFYHVPGPGALWLLGAASVLRSRRRSDGDCPRSRLGPIRGDQCR